jgi:CarD family transcriptional regulator
LGKKWQELSKGSKSFMEDGIYTVGNKLYYPVHGVAELTATESRTIGGMECAIYVLTIVETGLKIMVPTTNAESVGIRALVSNEEIDDVYEILQSKDGGTDTQTWNRRHREYMDKIKTGSAFEIAEVLRDLCLLRDKKTLSFGERRMLETARNLLVKEISCAQDKTQNAVEEEIESFFRAQAA